MLFRPFLVTFRDVSHANYNPGLHSGLIYFALSGLIKKKYLNFSSIFINLHPPSTTFSNIQSHSTTFQQHLTIFTNIQPSSTSHPFSPCSYMCCMMASMPGVHTQQMPNGHFFFGTRVKYCSIPFFWLNCPDNGEPPDM